MRKELHQKAKRGQTKDSLIESRCRSLFFFSHQGLQHPTAMDQKRVGGKIYSFCTDSYGASNRRKVHYIQPQETLNEVSSSASETSTTSQEELGLVRISSMGAPPCASDKLIPLFQGALLGKNSSWSPKYLKSLHVDSLGIPSDAGPSVCFDSLRVVEVRENSLVVTQESSVFAPVGISRYDMHAKKLGPLKRIKAPTEVFPGDVIVFDYLRWQCGAPPKHIFRVESTSSLGNRIKSANRAIIAIADGWEMNATQSELEKIFKSGDSCLVLSDDSSMEDIGADDESSFCLFSDTVSDSPEELGECQGDGITRVSEAGISSIHPETVCLPKRLSRKGHGHRIEKLCPKTGRVLARFESVRAAARSLGLSSAKSLYRCLRSRNHEFKGYIWDYQDSNSGTSGVFKRARKSSRIKATSNFSSVRGGQLVSSIASVWERCRCDSQQYSMIRACRIAI